MQANMIKIRKLLAICLSCTTFVASGLAAAAETNVRVDRPQSSIFVRPYQATTVPPIQSANTPRLSRLIRETLDKLPMPEDVAVAVDVDPYQLL